MSDSSISPEEAHTGAHPHVRSRRHIYDRPVETETTEVPRHRRPHTDGGRTLMTGDPSRIVCGGAAMFPLPPGPTCAGQARVLLASVMQGLGLPDGLVDDAVLAVSELATNVHRHAHNVVDPDAGAEMWAWVATRPCAQLVVSVFDTDRTAMPRLGAGDPLEEFGKGLSIVQHLTAAWGAHPTRSRLGLSPRPGKRVWFALGLPAGPWPRPLQVTSPALASKRLADLLRMRGIKATRICDDRGISLVTTRRTNIWVEPRAFAWSDGNGGQIRYPHLDLQETVEHIIATLDTATDSSHRPTGEDLHATPVPPLRRPRS